MPDMITISFFQAFSADGRRLFEDVRRALEGRTLRGLPVKLIEEKEYKMEAAMRACMESDAVIFDGSIEDEENRQYCAAIELMKQLDYVLVVSRTELPFNFEGMRKGGAPQLIMTSTTEYGYEKSNREILDWILGVLSDSNLELPRKDKSDFLEGGFQAGLEPIGRIESRLTAASKARMTDRSDAFVSYLSKYSKEYRGERTGLPFVETLFETIAQTCREKKGARFRAAAQARQTTPAEILYFPPGKISLEFMTGQRRFEIVSVTESYIERCGSFWIYETENYASSWWAYGERLSLSYMFYQDMSKCPDIYVAKPVKGPRGNWEFEVTGFLTPEEKEAFLPRLTEYEKRELSRIHINSEPNKVAYENIRDVRKLGRTPDALLRIRQALTVSAVEWMAPMMGLSEEEQQGYLDGLRDFDRFKESAHSFVYTREFWEDHIVECPDCKSRAGGGLTPEAFMHFKGGGFRAVSSSQYQSVMRELRKKPNGTDILLSCGHTVSVRRSGTYYRWWPMKFNKATGPHGRPIERIDFAEFC